MNRVIDKKNVSENYVFDNVVVLKVLAALAVFALHEGVTHGSDLTVSLMRFAVPMFFFMSAIIYGTRPMESFGFKFFCNRLKKLSNIYVPFVICASLFFLFVLHIPVMQVVREMVTDLLFLNGLVPTPIGDCGHLWFMTYLLIFYGLVKGVSWLVLRSDNYRKVMTCLLLALLVFNVCFVRFAKISYLTGYLLLFLNARFLLDKVRHSPFIKTVCVIVGLALLAIPIFYSSLKDGNLTGCLAAMLLILGTNYRFAPPEF